MISAGASRYSFILSAARLVVADTLGVSIGVMAALDRNRCGAIPPLEFVGQVRLEVDASWHAPVLQLHAATPYQLSPAPVCCLRSEWHVTKDGRCAALE
jgi:hypothetical protein